MRTVHRRGAVSTNGRREVLRFSVIPMDYCARCTSSRLADGARYGTPVALAGPLKHRTVRYVCRDCRSVWDVSWDVAALADFFPSYDTFSDTHIRAAEGLESHSQGGVELPAGPRSAFTRSEG